MDVHHQHVYGLKKLSDPRYIGPGKWDTFMIECAHARTKSLQQETVKFIRRQVENMRCECKDHAINYMKRNPPENMIGFVINNEQIGLLLWLWGFHNDVNKRLNKTYIPTWNEVYEYYWLKSTVYNVPCSVLIDDCTTDSEKVKDKILDIQAR